MKKGFLENMKESIGGSLNNFQVFLEKMFSSHESKEGIRAVFDKLRGMIGLKTRKDLNELKNKVEVKKGSESLKGIAENMMVFGDSIGVGLASVIDGLADSVTKGGLRSKSILENLKKYSKSMVGKKVVLMSGFNDLVNGKKGVESAIRYSEKMVGEVLKKGGEPVLCKLYIPKYKKIDNGYVEEFNLRIEKLAKKTGCKLVDLSMSKFSMAGDGLHLSKVGYEQMWEQVAKSIG